MKTMGRVAERKPNRKDSTEGEGKSPSPPLLSPPHPPQPLKYKDSTHEPSFKLPPLERIAYIFTFAVMGLFTIKPPLNPTFDTKTNPPNAPLNCILEQMFLHPIYTI
jgi:hypothetical protein